MTSKLTRELIDPIYSSVTIGILLIIESLIRMLYASFTFGAVVQ
jgi:hypothetical protein